MTDALELIIDVEDKPLEVNLDFKGEFISGASNDEYNRGYNEGYSKGYSTGEGIGYSTGEEKGYADGYKDADNNNLIQYANAGNLFRISNFPDDIIEINLYLPTQTDLTRIFYSAKANNLALIKIKGNDNSNAVNMEYGFWACPVPILDFSEYNVIPSKLNYAFAYLTKCVEIKGVFDLSQCTTVQGAFGNCTNLQEIRFKAETIKLSIDFGSCSMLSEESRQSIVEGLADLTGLTPQTLTVNKVVYEQLTDEQKATATNKNWTIAQKN